MLYGSAEIIGNCTNYFFAAQQVFFAAQHAFALPLCITFLAPQQPFFAAQHPFLAAQQPFLAAQQPFFAAQQPFFAAQALADATGFAAHCAIAGIAAIADAATTEALTTFFKVLLKDLAFIYVSRR
ncbi:hypothetical protein [Undibacterium sp. Di24W]|uniref:hypothetical protein n=1 Tax=Undibacterium sp. Di24W TaxID=3413033 RepID=UPI003BF38656